MEVKYKNIKQDRMRKAIQDAIEDAEIYYRCSGIQTEFKSDLELEQWNLDDPDAVVNEILAIIGDYIQEML